MERANAGLHPHITGRLVQLVPQRGARIVDVGCGSGSMLERLAALGYSDLHGIDIVQPQTQGAGISFVECDLDDLHTAFESASVDMIVSVEVFEHVENLGSLLKELSRLLRADGQMLITTPNVHSIEARLRLLVLGQLKQFDRIGDPTHISPIFMHPFSLLLKRHGLEVADLWGFPLDGSSPTSRPVLQGMGRVLRALGLRGAPSGDQLCLLIRKRRDTAQPQAKDKRQAVTAHYG